MSNLGVSATTTPYAVARSTTGISSSTPVSNTSSTTPKMASSSTTANQTVSVATSSNTATLSSSTTYAYGSSASNSISRMVSSSTTPNVTSSSTTPQVSSSSTTLPYGTLERNGGVITILTSSSTTPSVTSSSTTPPVSSSSTTLPYGTLERNGGVITILTSSSTTPPVSSSSTTLPYGTLERNGGYITILNSSSTTPSVTSSSTTPPVSSSSITLPPGTLERNGGYITILTSSSTTPNISSGDTTLSTGATTTPPAPGFDVNKIDYSYSSMIEEINNQIRALAYDSALKHEDPDGAKAKLAELQAMRQQIYQKMSMHNSISASVVEDIEYEAFSFTREEEKAFDLMVQENIMEYISAEEYSQPKWVKYTVEEKKELLSKLADYVCEQLGISITGIEYFQPDASISAYGKYVYSDNTVRINENCLIEKLGNGVVKTLIHELRHAYQNAVVDNPNLYVVSDETRDIWLHNMLYDYINGEDQVGYREQPVEWDVANFANQTGVLNKINLDLVTYEGSWSK